MFMSSLLQAKVVVLVVIIAYVCMYYILCTETLKNYSFNLL